MNASRKTTNRFFCIQLITIGLILALPVRLIADSVNLPQTCYLFSYFKDNGQDGLHLAWSIDGLNWKALNDDQSFLTPQVGKSKLMRDPCIAIGPDGTFHMVWTDSWDSKTIGYASSSNLIDWTKQKTIPVMEHEPSAKNAWAPEITYDSENKQFIIYWATTLPNRFRDTWFDGKNNNNHRIYYTTTSDFKTFSPTTLFFDPGFNCIDSTLLEKDGDFLMFYKDETTYPEAKKNLLLSISEKATGPYAPVQSPITPAGSWVEGPTSIEIGEYTYLYFDAYTEHHFAVLRSKNLIEWENLTDRLTMPKGIRHGTVFSVDSQVLGNLLKRETSINKTESWQLVFADEFESDGPPNPEVWQPERGFVRNEELQWYQSENAFVEDGLLVIEGRRECSPNPNYKAESSNWRTQRQYSEYTSSSLTTRKGFDFKYGKLEVKARIPVASGAWPAIWTLGERRPWPSNGEIDLMEYYLIDGQPHILANAAWASEERNEPIWDDEKIPFTHFTDQDPDWAAKFHIWSMEWDEEKITLSLDDETLNTIQLSDTINPDGFNPFTQAHYILLNLAIGGHGGEPITSSFPLAYEIDYVRVYQKNSP